MTGSVHANVCCGREDPQWLGEWDRMGEDVTLGRSSGPCRVAVENQHPRAYLPAENSMQTQFIIHPLALLTR